MSAIAVLKQEELEQLLERAAATGARIALDQAKPQDPDEWVGAAEASRTLYGEERPGAFRTLRGRHPGLDELSTGAGRARRWRRRDLQAWLRDNPRALRTSGSAP